MKFKCLLSGTVINVVHAHDIEDMKKHHQYVVYEEPILVEEVKPEEVKTVVKPTKKGK